MQSLPLNAPLVKYTPSSSQQGINDLKDNVTLFSVTEDPDAILHDQTFAFPITVGGVALIYNLNANLSAPLILTREIIVGIFNSSITTWDDERIARLNPTIASHVRFKAIRPYHRTTLSGTTYMFTQALSSFSSEWNKTYGSGMNIDWPFQQTEAIPSNADMITAVSFRAFSIGYVGIGDLDSDDISGGRGNIRVSYVQVRPTSSNTCISCTHGTFLYFRIKLAIKPFRRWLISRPQLRMLAMSSCATTTCRQMRWSIGYG